ncbi:hypothetical protein MMC17_009696 [Xylographa soralifera]|nr:hypothetical protein [Xylographa soralifera]
MNNSGTTQYTQNRIGVLFANTSQVDVATVLMLLGEGAIWKAIWARNRSQRSHFRKWIFAISPGWTPLAASLLTALSSNPGAPNLIYDRPPEGTMVDGLLLTNLNLGATHTASNPILQNIWQTWNEGPRAPKQRHGAGDSYDVTREVGVLELNLDALNLHSRFSFWFHALALATQLLGSLAFGLTGESLETFLVLVLALCGQTLLLAAITPGTLAWRKTIRNYKASPVMIHKGLESTGVMIVRRVLLDWQEISLEEFCWDSHVAHTAFDTAKVFAAGVAFLTLTFQILCIGWMATASRQLYLGFSALGLVANILEAASQPDWARVFDDAFSGKARCCPHKGSLLAAVAILLAGQFPAAVFAAKELYPNNTRFQETLDDLETVLDGIMCAQCRITIRQVTPKHAYSCLWSSTDHGRVKCLEVLAEKAKALESKQLRDGMAAIYHYLHSVETDAETNLLNTEIGVGNEKWYRWE